jgi:hypothetical protein
VYLKRLTILDRHFSGKMIVKKEVHAHQIEYDVSTQGPRGAWYSDPRNPKSMLVKQMAFQTYK